MTLDDLKRFCADADDSREYLRQPWTRDGYTWATEGHIIIRVPAIADIPDNKGAVDADGLFSRQPDAKEWLAVPTVKAPKPAKCDDCYGSGLHECNCGHEHTCGVCNGTGKVRAKVIAIPVGNSNFADRYLARIQGWEIAPNKEKPAWIRKDDALGLLMPRRI